MIWKKSGNKGLSESRWQRAERELECREWQGERELVESHEPQLQHPSPSGSSRTVLNPTAYHLGDFLKFAFQFQIHFFGDNVELSRGADEAL